MNNEVKYLYLDDIIPNRFQPRENFDEQALKELAVSIKEHGVIQPIIVRQIGEKYEIIAGERRYKASTMAGLTKIPAIVNNLDDKESSKVALIENLQRRDLTPIEEARTYQKILELDALTQEDLARTMGKSQSAVANKLRLLTLPEEVQDALLHEQISERHARSLLNVNSSEKQIELLKKVIGSRMTVRELDQEIKNMGSDQKMNSNINDNLNMPNNMMEPNNNMNQNNMGFVNPTTVDVNKFKNESVDISMQQSLNTSQPPQMGIDNMMSSNENQNNPLGSELNPMFNNSDEADDEPIGGTGLLAGIPMETPAQPAFNNFQQSNEQTGFNNNLYNSNSNNMSFDNNQMTDNNLMNNSDLMSNNNMMNNSMMEPNNMMNNNMMGNNLMDNNFMNTNEMPINNQMPNNITINNQHNNSSSNVEQTVERIKDSINTLRNEGKRIEVEDFDFDDFYQIVIRVDKQ